VKRHGHSGLVGLQAPELLFKLSTLGILSRTVEHGHMPNATYERSIERCGDLRKQGFLDRAVLFSVKTKLDELSIF
jgi:hypothetical protein